MVTTSGTDNHKSVTVSVVSTIIFVTGQRAERVNFRSNVKDAVVNVNVFISVVTSTTKTLNATLIRG